MTFMKTNGFVNWITDSVVSLDLRQLVVCLECCCTLPVLVDSVVCPRVNRFVVGIDRRSQHAVVVSQQKVHDVVDDHCSNRHTVGSNTNRRPVVLEKCLKLLIQRCIGCECVNRILRKKTPSNVCSPAAVRSRTTVKLCSLNACETARTLSPS